MAVDAEERLDQLEGTVAALRDELDELQVELRSWQEQHNRLCGEFLRNILASLRRQVASKESQEALIGNLEQLLNELGS
jgi:predicted nuclease with TOPRIM domain